MQKTSNEIRGMCKKVESCFKKISCFLMPHPGLRLAAAVNPVYIGSVLIFFFTTKNSFKLLLKTAKFTVFYYKNFLEPLFLSDVCCLEPEKDFLPQVQSLVEQLFSKGWVTAKKLDREEITSEDMVTLFRVSL